jgi:Zn-dependent protease
MLASGNINPTLIVIVILVALMAMTVHEYAHARMATWWGDDTPRLLGRLTLNPAVHINWMGFLMFVLVGFGILGSVPINVRRMRDPRWGSFWTSFAGPLSNLALAVAFALIYRVLVLMDISFLSGGLLSILVTFIYYSILFNLLLFAFNLLPFFPIDGWHMMLALLPGDWLARHQVPPFIAQNMRPIARFLQEPAFQWQRWAQLSQIVLLFLVFLSLARIGINPLNTLIWGPVSFLLGILVG